MFADPVFFPVAIFWLQTSSYLMDIEKTVLKLSFSNISWGGGGEGFHIRFSCKRSKRYVELGFKGLLHILMNPILFYLFYFRLT